MFRSFGFQKNLFKQPMNAKFTLKYQYEGCEDFAPADITFEIPGDVTIPQFLYQIECFLKASGFVFDGNIDIVSSHQEKHQENIKDSISDNFLDDSDWWKKDNL